MKNIRLVLLFYFLIYVLLFFFALNFNYVEGDDAATILYHLCGRNPQVQPPYAAYHSGMDLLLQMSGLQTETALRIFAISVSFISGFLILALLALLLESLFKDSKLVGEKHRKYFYLLLPLLLPDVLFHSLIVNASNISFVFLLGSLLCFVRFLKRQQYQYLAFAMVLFAVSVPFRWTMLIALPLYPGLFLYVHPLQNYPKPLWILAAKIALSMLIGVVLAIVCIGISGYDLDGIRQTIASTTGYLEKSELSVLSLMASGTAFLTPALVAVVLFSLVKIRTIETSRQTVTLSVLGLVLLSASPFFVFGFYPMYKYSMTFLPALLVLMLLGFDYLMGRKILRILLLSAIVLPWFVGIQIDAKGTFCGPGFELNMQKIAPGNTVASQNPDSRVKIEKVRPVFDSGFYMPMAEGPRPLYGYGYVLLGGKWKNQVENLAKEREATFGFLNRHKDAVFFQDRQSSYFSCDLYRHGFQTRTDFLEKEGQSYRVFTKDKDTVVLRIVPSSAKAEWMRTYFKDARTPVVYRSSYSNDILNLKMSTPGTIVFLGPFTAIKR